MTLRLPVDDEQLVIDYLANQPDVAARVAGRVAGKLPNPLVLPCIRIIRLGGTSPAPHRLDRPRQQIECYAGDDAAAKDLSATVRAALPLIVGVHAVGTVTAYDELSGPQWLPDAAAGEGATPTPRYLFSVQLTTHPN